MDPILFAAVVGGALVVDFLAGLCVGVRSRPPKEHPRMLVCYHCGAPKAGHRDKELRCPCVWDGKIIKFFKPLTLNQWMKREGIDDVE